MEQTMTLCGSNTSTPGHNLPGSAADGAPQAASVSLSKDDQGMLGRIWGINIPVEPFQI